MIVQLNHIWNLQNITMEMAQRGERAPLDILAGVPMPTVKSFALSKQIAAIRRETTALEAERVKLIQKLGTEQKDDEGNVTGHSIPNGSEAWKQFVAEIEELCAVTVEIPGDLLTLADLGEVEISATALGALGFLFAEESAKPAKVTSIKARKRQAA